ncbi:MAG: hypothetical protein ACD_73C00506G0003 [uncultured bacterium]|nr:MAG: hypothetical protein ACD_73C00506G0003 [uncultured bacterium]
MWAPLLDTIGTRKGWMIKLQWSLTLLTALMAILAGYHEFSQNSSLLTIMAFLFVLMAFMAATNDVAIDAYYLEGLKTAQDQAKFSGHRTLAYRLAVVYSRSVLVAIAGFSNWFFGFGAGALTLLIFTLLHKFLLPEFANVHTQKATIESVMANFKEAFLTYIKRDRILLIIFFIITYKLGDEILFSMNTPFLMRELGVTKPQIAWLAGIVAAFSTVAGSLLGAYWIRKKGFNKTIWPITIIMNLTILAYLILSEGKPQAATLSGISLIAIIHAYENLASGLGSAVLGVYLMRLCHTQFKATHFAIGTAIMSLGSTFFGGFSGFIVEKAGYTNLFLLGFVLALPSMILLKWIPLEKESN